MPGTSLSTPASYPAWAAQMIALYESNAVSQFILYGNVNDRVLLPETAGGVRGSGSLADFVLHGLLPSFDVVLSYDIANGLRVEKGGETFCQWPGFKEQPELPKAPRPAMELLTRYFRFCANLARLSRGRMSVGCIVKSAELLAPAAAGMSGYEINSLALLLREWAEDPLLAEHALATCLLTENLNDLHPLLVNNARAAKLKIPLPEPREIEAALAAQPAERAAVALGEFRENRAALASQLAGATLHSIDALLKLKAYRKEPLSQGDLVALKKRIVEEECQGLIEFVQPRRTLDDLHGQERLKEWLRQDIELWRQNDLQALPMGYLICGPVGTGKTFMVECLAGEAGVPVVKIRNFRDKWVGSTEGNLEKIFRLLQALGRCYVFIDEADQALGKRDAGSGDSGLSGRIYSMIAAEMSQAANRGRILWVLASSRPDLIEVDLKRPGRVDVKLPIFPTATREEGWGLLRALAGRQGVVLEPGDFSRVAEKIPPLLTPGAAEALAVKLYRTLRTSKGGGDPVEALSQCLEGYRNPVPADVLQFQIGLAVAEASDIDFVPAAFRGNRELLPHAD